MEFQLFYLLVDGRQLLRLINFTISNFNEPWTDCEKTKFIFGDIIKQFRFEKFDRQKKWIKSLIAAWNRTKTLGANEMRCGKNMIHRVPSIYKKNILESPANEICIWVPANEIMHTHAHTRAAEPFRAHTGTIDGHTHTHASAHSQSSSQSKYSYYFSSQFVLSLFHRFQMKPKKKPWNERRRQKKMFWRRPKWQKKKYNKNKNVEFVGRKCESSALVLQIFLPVSHNWLLFRISSVLNPILCARCFVGKIFFVFRTSKRWMFCENKNKKQWTIWRQCALFSCCGVSTFALSSGKEKLTRKLNDSFGIKDDVRPDRTKKCNIHTAALRLTNTKYEHEEMPALAVCNEMFSQLNMATPIQLMCEVWWGYFARMW